MAINVLIILGVVLLFFGVMWKIYCINMSTKSLTPPDDRKTKQRGER